MRSGNSDHEDWNNDPIENSKSRNHAPFHASKGLDRQARRAKNRIILSWTIVIGTILFFSWAVFR